MVVIVDAFRGLVLSALQVCAGSNLFVDGQYACRRVGIFRCQVVGLANVYFSAALDCMFL